MGGGRGGAGWPMQTYLLVCLLGFKGASTAKASLRPSSTHGKMQEGSTNNTSVIPMKYVLQCGSLPCSSRMKATEVVDDVYKYHYR